MRIAIIVAKRRESDVVPTLYYNELCGNGPLVREGCRLKDFRCTYDMLFLTIDKSRIESSVKVVRAKDRELVSFSASPRTVGESVNSSPLGTASLANSEISRSFGTSDLPE